MNEGGVISDALVPLFSYLLPTWGTALTLLAFLLIIAILISMLLATILVFLTTLLLNSINVMVAIDAENLFILNRSDRIVSALKNTSMFADQSETRLSFGPGPKDINKIISRSTNSQAACDQIAHRYQRTIDYNNDVLREKDKELTKAKQNLGLVTIHVLMMSAIILFLFFYA